MAADPRLIEFAREMRREPTPAEKTMWRLLRNQRLSGFKFRRQHPVGRYIADFYVAQSALIVELDGDTHATPEGIEHDRVRHQYLESLGFAVVRFWNSQIHDEPDLVLDHIWKLCTTREGQRRRLTPPGDRRDRKPQG